MDNNHPGEDVTSDYGDSVASEFTTINNTRTLHAYEHGRRYQAILQGRYGLPNDEAEQEREGVKHKMYTDYILEDKLFLAPVGDNPQKIVDLGCGFGFWAQDVAEKFPSARVIGTDLSPIQPDWSAPNVEFRVEDLEDELRPWTNIYTDADLIHIRAMLNTLKNPQRLLAKAFENLRPGGWIECHELDAKAFSDDDTVGDGYPLNEVFERAAGPFAAVYGWKLYFSLELPEALRRAGFINISGKRNHFPIGRWHQDATMREKGLFCQSVLSDFVATMLVKNEEMGLTEEQAQTLGQSTLDAFNTPSIHAMLNWRACWAQKPL